MRAWTLAGSIVFHLCVIGAVIVSPLFATDELPEPPRTEVWVRVSARLPAPPPEPRPPVPARDVNAAPLTASDTVSPEPPAPQPAVPGPVDFDVSDDGPLTGAFAPGVVPSDDLLPLPPPPPPAPKPVYRVGGNIRAPEKIYDVPPRYPAIAQAGGIEGLVILEAVISEDGSVQNVRVLRGKPLLDEAATAAVRQWRFTPPLLNGEPVPVVMTVTVSFRLDKR